MEGCSRSAHFQAGIRVPRSLAETQVMEPGSRVSNSGSPGKDENVHILHMPRMLGLLVQGPQSGCPSWVPLRLGHHSCPSHLPCSPPPAWPLPPRHLLCSHLSFLGSVCMLSPGKPFLTPKSGGRAPLPCCLKPDGFCSQGTSHIGGSATCLAFRPPLASPCRTP